MLENYKFKFKSRDKFVFVPTLECGRRAQRIIRFGAELDLPDYFFHYQPGGHVEALHRHLENTRFFRVDLKNFFYSISRNRISRLLRQCGFPKSAREYAEWSTVRNPYPNGPRYVLPIGFPQSPLLASLVLYRSAIASAIEHAINRGVFVSVYFDDFIGSSKDEHELRMAYNGILAACGQANLTANPDKLSEPAAEITAFNCHLSHGVAKVTQEREDRFVDECIGRFVDECSKQRALDSFIIYCDRVSQRNYIP